MQHAAESRWRLENPQVLTTVYPLFSWIVVGSVNLSSCQRVYSSQESMPVWLLLPAGWPGRKKLGPF